MPGIAWTDLLIGLVTMAAMAVGIAICVWIDPSNQPRDDEDSDR